MAIVYSVDPRLNAANSVCSSRRNPTPHPYGFTPILLFFAAHHQRRHRRRPCPYQLTDIRVIISSHPQHSPNHQSQPQKYPSHSSQRYRSPGNNRSPSTSALLSLRSIRSRQHRCLTPKHCPPRRSRCLSKKRRPPPVNGLFGSGTPRGLNLLMLGLFWFANQAFPTTIDRNCVRSIQAAAGEPRCP